MVLKNKNILIISPEPWHGSFVSKHHYALHLAERENKIYFLNPPSREWRVSSVSPRLDVIDYPQFVKGFRLLPNFLKRLIFKNRYSKIQELVNAKIDVVWSFDSSVFYDFNALDSEVLKIFHLVDLNQNFHLKEGASTADICFCTSDLILKNLQVYTKQVYKIHHGVNLLKAQPVKTLPGLNSIKAVYIGSLSISFIDWQVLFRTASSNTDVDFIFIGPGGAQAKIMSEEDVVNAIHDLSNTYFLPRVNANEIPTIISAADILLVCYQEDYHDQASSPHKIMEYISSGKVTVATFTEEYKYYPGLIEMSSKNSDFSNLFSKVKTNLDYYNDKDHQEKRIAFAKNHSYQSQIDKIEKLLPSK